MIDAWSGWDRGGGRGRYRQERASDSERGGGGGREVRGVVAVVVVLVVVVEFGSLSFISIIPLSLYLSLSLYLNRSINLSMALNGNQLALLALCGTVVCVILGAAYMFFGKGKKKRNLFDE